MPGPSFVFHTAQRTTQSLRIPIHWFRLYAPGRLSNIVTCAALEQERSGGQAQ